MLSPKMQPNENDEQRDPDAAREVASDVRAKGGEPDGHGHEPHDLTEDFPCAVTRDRLAAEGDFVNGGHGHDS